MEVTMNQPIINDDGKLERKFVVHQIKKLREEWREAVGDGVSLKFSNATSAYS